MTNQEAGKLYALLQAYHRDYAVSLNVTIDEVLISLQERLNIR